MTRVAELEHEWRDAATAIDRDDIPWGRAARMTEQSWDLGEELLRTPASDLDDVAIKVQWLAEQDLDRASYRNALKCLLTDLKRLGAH